MKFVLYLYLVLIGSLLLMIVINFFYSPIFMSSKYASRIEINENTDFNADIKEIDFNNLPLLDKESSSKSSLSFAEIKNTVATAT